MLNKLKQLYAKFRKKPKIKLEDLKTYDSMVKYVKESEEVQEYILNSLDKIPENKRIYH